MDMPRFTQTPVDAPACHAPPLALHGFGHINRYWDRYNGTYAAKILPGQFYVTRHDEVIVTVLGSCIAACVRDPRTGLGGMNHFMLPARSPLRDAEQDPGEAARYGNYAMELLINEILKHGGERGRLEVKLFGGGRIINQMTDVGRRNIEFARDFVHTEGLHLAASDLGDVYPRKVYYFPATGRVRLRKLRALHNDTLINRERDYMRDINRQPVAGEVDLF